MGLPLLLMFVSIVFAGSISYPEDFYPGDLVQIQLVNGERFVGNLSAVHAETLELVLPGHDVAGSSITVDRRNISSLVVLSHFKGKEAKTLFQRYHREEAERVPRVPPQDRPEQKSIPSAESSSSPSPASSPPSESLLSEFPEKEGWSQERYNTLSKQDPATLSVQEKTFLEKFPAWKEEREALKQKLLKEFPPGETWSEKQYQFLKNKFIILGFPPTAEEQKFVDHFSLWSEAVHDSAEQKK